MTQIDRRITQPAIDAALDLIGEAAATAVDDTAKRLDTLANVTATTYVAERDAIVSAQRDLSHQLPLFHRAFNDGLRKKVMLEFSPRHERRQPQPSTTWESLSLVEDTALEERMFSDRLGRGIEDASEWELRELARYTAALLPPGETGKDPNPFRPEVLGAALYSAIEAVSTELECRKLLAREMGPVVAKHMRSCYSEIVADLKSRGVQPVQLGLRGVDGSGNDRTATGFGSQVGDLRNAKGGDHNEQLDTGSPASSGWMRGARFDSSGLGSMPRGGSNASSASAWVNRPYATGGTDGSGSEPAVVDAELMSLIRRLAVVSGHAGDAADAETRSASIFGASSGGDSGAGLALGTGDLRGDGLTGTVAVNLIRAHRDELRRASNGTIEHMVIDVVASLFDQILSDSRVAPQMARQIGRLQLPVLRVALSDSSFFSTRKHPVRRFVNRLASLASAFEDFNDGPGKKFLERVSALVQEIIDGDFDQVDVYTDKLNLLEGFIERQIQSDVQANGAATLLDGKESELLAQQRYMQQLRTALAPLEVPDYLRDFLSQVWSQTLVFANRRDGPMAERTVRMRRAACDLVMSVQPKDTSALRKAFLMGLPRLMKDLTDGLKLIGWPEAAQKEFFARLLPAHSEALRNMGQSELDRNLLAKQLEAVFNAPVPSGAQHVPVGATSAFDGATIENQFSAEEALQIGLVPEAAVDWNGSIDIDLGADEQEQAEAVDSPKEQEQLDLGQGLNLNTHPEEQVEPSRGLALMDYMKVGIAYQMHLKDNWEKVRLTYVSKGRGFFVFTHGKTHQETISLTARMLARMCETGRMRAFESHQLLERATVRARRQLAAIKSSNSASFSPASAVAQAA